MQRCPIYLTLELCFNNYLKRYFPGHTKPSSTSLITVEAEQPRWTLNGINQKAQWQPRFCSKGYLVSVLNLIVQIVFMMEVRLRALIALSRLVGDTKGAEE